MHAYVLHTDDGKQNVSSIPQFCQIFHKFCKLFKITESLMMTIL